MREDKQMLMLTHLMGIGGFILPLIIWLSQKEKVLGMDTHGKMALNFQISVFIYSILSIPLIMLSGLGFFILAGLVILVLVFPVLNAIKVDKMEIPSYPLMMEIIK